MNQLFETYKLRSVPILHQEKIFPTNDFFSILKVVYVIVIDNSSRIG